MLQAPCKNHKQKGDIAVGRDFRKLTAWQKADELVVRIYRLTASAFPAEEKFGLKSQIRAAAVSVAANIAEGSARGTDADFRRFLWIAQGSLTEVEYYLHLSERLGYLEGAEYAEISSVRALAGRTLTGLLRAVAGSQSVGEQAGRRNRKSAGRF